MTTSAEDERPILVLGGTGRTGRRVVERLTAGGVPTRIGSRSGQPLFDWSDQATWAPALQGVGAVYVSYYPDLAIPGAPGGGLDGRALRMVHAELQRGLPRRPDPQR